MNNLDIYILGFAVSTCFWAFFFTSKKPEGDFEVFLASILAVVAGVFWFVSLPTFVVMLLMKWRLAK